MRMLEKDFMKIAKLFETDDVTIRLKFHKLIQEGIILIPNKNEIEII